MSLHPVHDSTINRTKKWGRGCSPRTTGRGVHRQAKKNTGVEEVHRGGVVPNTKHRCTEIAKNRPKPVCPAHRLLPRRCTHLYRRWPQGVYKMATVSSQNYHILSWRGTSLQTWVHKQKKNYKLLKLTIGRNTEQFEVQYLT